MLGRRLLGSAAPRFGGEGFQPCERSLGHADPGLPRPLPDHHRPRLRGRKSSCSATPPSRGPAGAHPKPGSRGSASTSSRLRGLGRMLLVVSSSKRGDDELRQEARPVPPHQVDQNRSRCCGTPGATAAACFPHVWQDATRSHSRRGWEYRDGDLRRGHFGPRHAACN